MRDSGSYSWSTISTTCCSSYAQLGVWVSLWNPSSAKSMTTLIVISMSIGHRCWNACRILLCFTRYPSPLSKFESKFQKTYATQKLRKVPDPKMRRRLRKAVVDKVIPVFTQFLEDNSIVTPGFTPRKLEKMLGELFEGWWTSAPYKASCPKYSIVNTASICIEFTVMLGFWNKM